MSLCKVQYVYFHLPRQKKSAEFLQAMEEDRWVDSPLNQSIPDLLHQKRYEPLQHIAALIELFSTYQTKPSYRALSK